MNLISFKYGVISILIFQTVLFANDLKTLDKTIVSEFKAEATSTLSGQELLDKMGENLASTLDNELNFSKRSMGSAPSRPVVRGLGGDHIQIAENGNDVVDLSGTSPDHAVGVSANQMKKIELLQGVDLIPHNLSLLGVRVEGDRGLFMTDPLDYINGSIYLGGFTHGLGLTSGLQIEVPIKQFTGRVQLSGSSLGNNQSPEKILDNTNSEQWEVAGALQFDSDHNRVSSDFINYQLEYGIPGGFVGSHLNGVRIKMDRTSYHLGHAYYYSKGSIKSQFSYNDFHQIEREDDGPVGAEFLVKEYSGDLTLKHVQSKSLELNFGMGIGFEDRKYGGFVYTPFTQRVNTSLWGISKLFQKSIFPISIGVRSEYSSDDLSGIFEQRNGESIKPMEIFSISTYLEHEKEVSDLLYVLGVYTTSRIPTVEELYSQGPHLAAYSYELGNENLNRERGVGGKLNFNYSLSDWSFTGEGGYTYFQNFIRTRPNGKINWATQLLEYEVQDGKAVHTGWAFSIESPSIVGFQSQSQIDYAYGQDLDLDEPLPAIPPMRWLNRVSYLINSHEFNFESIYYFKQDRLSKFETETESNAVFNLGYNVQEVFSNGFFRFNFEVENVFNQTYFNHLSRIKEIMPEASRRYIAKLSYTF